MAGINLNYERYRCSSRYWWMMLLVGIAAAVIGILVFAYPGQSYTGLALVFGFLILASGILELFYGSRTPRQQGQGWLIASGVIEVIIGLVLVFNPGLSAAVLPFFLGFWLLFRGFTIIGLASDMRALDIQGTGWTIFFAIVLIILAIMVLLNPVIGVGAIVVWLGLSFLITGLTMTVFSFRQRSLCKHFTV